MAYPTDPIYKLYNSPLPGGGLDGVMTQQDNKTICIPLDPENSDYQEYHKWKNGEDPYTEKGTPEPAD